MAIAKPARSACVISLAAMGLAVFLALPRQHKPADAKDAIVIVPYGYESLEEVMTVARAADRICAEPPGPSRDQRLQALARANPSLQLECRKPDKQSITI